MIEPVSTEIYREWKERASKEAAERWGVRAGRGAMSAGQKAVARIDEMVGGTRLCDYVTGVAASPEQHNLYEMLAVCRWGRMAEKYEVRPERVARFVAFFEHLPLPGPEGRQLYKVSPPQLFELANIYGLYTQAGRRLIREVLLFVPRKYGKTTICAAMALYDALFGDADAEAYISANSFQQAKKGFDGIKEIVEFLDPKGRHFSTNLQSVRLRMKGRESLVRCLTSNPKTLDGLKASISISDELSQATSFATKNVVTTSMGVRREPMTVDITTASELVDGPFVDELTDYQRILRGEKDNDSVFAHLFLPDPWDDEAEPATWVKVNPHIGYTVDAHFYQDEYVKAQRSYDNLVTFRTKLLNIFVTGSLEAWLPADKIWPLMQPVNFTAFDRPPAGVCAIDLSVKDDFSCVTYMVYDSERQHFLSRTDFYFPAGQLERHPNATLYKKWVDEGWLHLIDGDVIDYELIAQAIIHENDSIMLIAIGYDSYKDTDLINMLRASGAGRVLHAVGQTRSNFTAPVAEMEILVHKGCITFDNNPITAWCFGNAVIDEDNNGNRKPMKRSPSWKIDATITNLMCLKLFGSVVR